ncbi:MAG: hypothetical protein IT440_03375 [Phycisphaeraceae bacterium]|nr:hypothetical protein [Phycisphaeraceae bacterium]
MSATLALLFTATAYGQWLRGDRRGWVDDGRILPPNPLLEAADAAKMAHEPFLFPQHRLYDVGQAVAVSLTSRLNVTLLALAVQTWHLHVVIGATPHDVAVVVKCFKDAARYALRPGRPIWTDGYDKRFCFDVMSVRTRVRYVERHNEQMGLSPRPYPFITDVDAYLAPRQ